MWTLVKGRLVGGKDTPLSIKGGVWYKKDKNHLEECETASSSLNGLYSRIQISVNVQR